MPSDPAVLSRHKVNLLLRRLPALPIVAPYASAFIPAHRLPGTRTVARAFGIWDNLKSRNSETDLKSIRRLPMATNLVSYVMLFLTPDMTGRIANALALNRSDVQSGVSAAVPALLAVFGGLADKPGGALNLVNTIKQQSGVVDNFASMIGGSNQSSFIERGSSQLASLIGSHDKAALAGAVASCTNLGQNGASSLLGVLTPVVMGLLGKQIGTRGVDVGSLTSLLASQRDQIAQALPPGMGELLDRTGLASLGGVTGPAAPQAGRVTTAATDQFRPEPSSAARQAGTTRERAAGATTYGIPNWAYWALPLLALGGLLWYLLGRPAQQEQATQPLPTPQATTPAPSIVVGGVDIKQQLGEGLSDLRMSLQGVTDAASAKAALPKLEGAGTQIDKVSSLVGQLTPDQRKIVAGLVASAMPTINRLSDEVLEIPGVGEVLRPTFDPIKTKLADLSGQPSTVGAGGR
jgi:hypothetical protein